MGLNQDKEKWMPTNSPFSTPIRLFQSRDGVQHQIYSWNTEVEEKNEKTSSNLIIYIERKLHDFHINEDSPLVIFIL
jgi:hypothetical protein